MKDKKKGRKCIEEIVRDKYCADIKFLGDKYEADIKPFRNKYHADIKFLGDKYDAYLSKNKWARRIEK